MKLIPIHFIDQPQSDQLVMAISEQSGLPVVGMRSIQARRDSGGNAVQ